MECLSTSVRTLRMVEMRLHHVGYVVASIEEALPGFLDSLGAQADSVVIHDPLQKVFVQFVRVPSQDGVLLELVAPAGESSPVQSLMERGGGLHHVCYEVNDLQRAVAEARSRKCILLRAPKPAVAFGGRRIAWVMTAEKLLIEYLEAAC